MLKKSKLVLFSAASISALTISNTMGTETAKVGNLSQQDYKQMNASVDNCGPVCQRKKAIEAAEKEQKEAAAKSAVRRPSASASAPWSAKRAAEAKKAEELKKAEEEKNTLKRSEAQQSLIRAKLGI